MASLRSRCGHYIMQLYVVSVFLLLFSLLFLLFFLAYSQRSQIGCLPYFHTWCGLSANAGLKCAARGSLKIQDAKITEKSPSAHHRTTLSGCIFATRHVSTLRKTLLNSNISSTCPRSMVNFGPLTAEIGWRVCGTPANFNGFRILTSLNAGQPNFACRLAVSCAGALCIHLGGSCPCQVRNSLCVQVLRSPMGSVTAQHANSGREPNFTAWYKEWIMELLLLVIFNRGRHLYSEGGHHVGHIGPHSSLSNVIL